MAIHVGRRVRGLSDALTLAINSRFKAMVAAGADAISFGTGEPDFDTPAHVRDAAKRSIDEGFTRYTPSSGMPALREAIAKRLAERNGIRCPASCVVVTNGAKQALYQALQVLVDDGDEVLIPQPYWLSYPEMARAAGAVPVAVPCDESDGWRLRADAIEREISPRTRVLVLNSPNNPTGAVLSRAELEAVADVCRRRDLVVVSDEIYEDMVYEGARAVSFASLSADAAARTVTVGGVSKSYAMTGWRIGWAAGPKEVMEPFGNLQSHLTSNAASVSQRAALQALVGDQTELTEMVARFDERRRAMVDALAAIPGITLVPPRGAFYVFLRVDRLYGRRPGISGSVSFCEALLEDRKVACVPGVAFGSDAHVRLSYAASIEDIRRGCERIREFVAAMQ